MFAGQAIEGVSQNLLPPEVDVEVEFPHFAIHVLGRQLAAIQHISILFHQHGQVSEGHLINRSEVDLPRSSSVN